MNEEIIVGSLTDKGTVTWMDDVSPNVPDPLVKVSSVDGIKYRRSELKLIEKEKTINPLKVGDNVVKNPETWVVNDFDGWGRGIGVGVVVEPPFEMEDNEVDVRWPNGRCFENINQIKKA